MMKKLVNDKEELLQIHPPTHEHEHTHAHFHCQSNMDSFPLSSLYKCSKSFKYNDNLYITFKLFWLQQKSVILTVNFACRINTVTFIFSKKITTNDSSNIILIPKYYLAISTICNISMKYFTFPFFLSLFFEIKPYFPYLSVVFVPELLSKIMV